MTIRYYFEKKEGLAPLRINALRASPIFLWPSLGETWPCSLISFFVSRLSFPRSAFFQFLLNK